VLQLTVGNVLELYSVFVDRIRHLLYGLSCSVSSWLNTHWWVIKYESGDVLYLLTDVNVTTAEYET